MTWSRYRIKKHRHFLICISFIIVPKLSSEQKQQIDECPTLVLSFNYLLFSWVSVCLHHHVFKSSTNSPQTETIYPVVVTTTTGVTQRPLFMKYV